MKRFNPLPSGILCAAFALTGAFSAIAAPPSSRITNETRHSSGIAIVGPGSHQPQPTNKAQEVAYRNALSAAQANPDDLGYPWLDAMGLVQRHITPKGLELANKVAAAIPRRTVSARFSYGQLEGIKHEIIDLRKAGFVGADVIWQTQPDEKSNRVIVTVSRLDDALMGRLAEVYGTQSIAIRVMPYPAGGLGPHRQYDHAPYSGGAAYLPSGAAGCTLGFAFTNGFTTAGHCETGSGWASTVWDRYLHIGFVEAYNLNWVYGTGTVSFPGYKETNVFRGDLALIQTASSAELRPRIYMGAPDSEIKRNVSEMFWRESNANDIYCTSGKMTGQLCEWRVMNTRVDVEYREAGRPTMTARNVTYGERAGPGTIPGDSGGPVYTYDANWGVSAKGITSGGNLDPNERPSRHYFTEIRQASAYFGGALKTGSKVILVINENSDKCLDVAGDATGNGAAIIQYQCHGGINQQWYFEDVPYTYPARVKIVNERGKCLSIDQNLQTNGAKAHTWTCFDNNGGQQWIRNSNGTLVNGYGKCLGIDYNSPDDRARVTQWDCINAPSQKWSWLGS